LADMLFTIAGVIAALAGAISFIRLLAGPSVADRAVALDAMTIIALSVIATIAMFAGRAIYIDVALVYGLVSFLGVIALARFIERGM
jgi:multicomponent Na+:H+ antiporter subunit F